jgi:hypothetical protein
MMALAAWARSNWPLLAFICGLVLVFAVLRNKPTEGIDSLQALDVSIRAGQPTVLEFYSNF